VRDTTGQQTERFQLRRTHHLGLTPGSLAHIAKDEDHAHRRTIGAPQGRRATLAKHHAA